MVEINKLIAEEVELQTRLEQIKVEKIAAAALEKQRIEEEARQAAKSEEDPKVKAEKRPKRKMKTNKKFFMWLTIWAMIMQTYVLVMIVELRDTMTLSIVAGVVFGEIVLFYLGYLKYTLNIDLKHMDKNYNPNYDEEKNIY